MTKERIEIIRQSLIPFVKKELLKINYEGLGKSDSEEFEKDLNEVLDLASKALEQPTSDDCIAREPLIKNWKCCADMLTDEGDSEIVMSWILDAPPVTPTQRWIPVNERLPKKGGDYLITTSFDIGTKETVREVYKDFFCVLSQKWLNHDEDAIAWQPLPKPYEEKAR